MDIPTFGQIFAQIKTNFRIVGIPLDESKITTRYFVIVFEIFVVVSQTFAFFVSKISSENFLVLVDLAPLLANGVNTYVKIICLSLKRRKICELATSLENMNREALQDEKNIAVIKGPIIFVNNLVKYYFILNTVLVTVYNYATLFVMAYLYIKTNEVVYLFPFPIWVPFSTDSWKPWLVMYLHSICSGFTTILWATTSDTLYCVFTSHVCSCFAVLSNEIISLNKNNSHKLTDIIKRHQNILKLSEDLEDIFAAPNLSNVLCGSLDICALAFYLTAGDTSRRPGVALFLATILLQMLLISIYGDHLIQESTKVGDAAFLCNWYEMDIKSRKQILTIIHRSNKPQKLTAYKFSTLGYESFSKIISKSWSYFTILKTVYSPPE